jgi:methyl-accepting chemotaxis protein
VLHIQSASVETVESIRRINVDIKDMDEKLRSIAQSVGSQEAAAAEIVTAISLFASSLSSVREALGKIHNGASSNYDRVEKMRSYLDVCSASPAAVS